MKRIFAVQALMMAGCYGALAADPQPVALSGWKHDISPPLREMAARATGTVSAGWRPPTPDATGPVLGKNFPGISAAEDPGARLPPDANGAAGLTQYVQWVNTVLAVFSKSTGQVLLGPAPGNSIWEGFGGRCENHNSGQPIAQYDKSAGRWVLAQPVLSAPYAYCIAVSLTADATGQYHRFAFPLMTLVPAGARPDSPKLAVWKDAYYTSFNLVQNNEVAGAMAIAFDRTMMLNGTSRAPIGFLLSGSRSYMLPSDWDGPTPPKPGEPNFYMRVGSPSKLQLFKFHVDFNSPGNSTFSAQPIIITVTPPPQEIHPNLCTHKPGHCYNIMQPAPGDALDANPNALMYRLAWRTVNGVEHLMANQTVYGTSSLASINWYDITNPNAVPQLLQQGAVSDSSLNYWMGSMAMDKVGDIALGFNASSSTEFPSIGMTGRLVTDPLGTMGPVQIIVPGSDVQTISGAWGSFTSMSLDPTDGCTFWFTAEYIADPPIGGTPNWSTWIASMKFPSCQ